MITAILWDLDGTLLDTLNDLADSVNVSLSAFGFPTHSREKIRSFVGNGVYKLIARAVPAGTDEASETAVREFFQKHYGEHANDTTAPYPGILPLLRELRDAGVKMAVVSNKPDFATKDLVRQHFGDLIPAAVGGRDGVPVKPAREMVQLGLDALGVTAENAVYIGDSEVDVQTAKNAGMRGIFVDWGFRDESVLRQAGAQTVAHTAEQLRCEIFSQP